MSQLGKKPRYTFSHEEELEAYREAMGDRYKRDPERKPEITRACIKASGSKLTAPQTENN